MFETWNTASCMLHRWLNSKSRWPHGAEKRISAVPQFALSRRFDSLLYCFRYREFVSVCVSAYHHTTGASLDALIAKRRSEEWATARASLRCRRSRSFSGIIRSGVGLGRGKVPEGVGDLWVMFPPIKPTPAPSPSRAFTSPQFYFRINNAWKWTRMPATQASSSNCPAPPKHPQTFSFHPLLTLPL